MPLLSGPAVLLLHGWPLRFIHSHSFVDVTNADAGRRGYRVIVPYLRGYCRRAFLSAETLAGRHQSAIAAGYRCADAMPPYREGNRFAVFDWGSRTATHHRGVVAGKRLQGSSSSVSGY